MEKIKSFTINHDTHSPGFYLSNESNGIYAYDLRFKWPNKNDYLSTASAHSIEHIFATVIRNSAKKEQVVYFGPMGCRTGFYLLLLDIKPDEAYDLVVECLEKSLQINEIPGSEKSECGNYLDHSLSLAKHEIEEYLKILKKQAKN